MYKQKRGFTLIELLIVIAVIGILSGIVLTVINSTALKARTRDGQRKNDLAKIQLALDLYFVDNREYPNVNNGLWIKITEGDDLYNTITGSGASSKVYMNNFPIDPLNTGTGTTPCAGVNNYGYFYTNTNVLQGSSRYATGYILAAIMEDATSNDSNTCGASAVRLWNVSRCGPAGNLACGCSANATILDVCYAVESPL